MIAPSAILGIARKHQVPLARIGSVGGGRLAIGDKIDLAVKEISKIYDSAIPKRMEQ